MLPYSETEKMLRYSETSQKRRKYLRGKCEIKATSPLPPFKGGKAKSGWLFHPFDVIKSSAFRKEGGAFLLCYDFVFILENEMSTVTFDTLQFVQTLKESGFEEKQAEGMAKAFREAQDQSETATKNDLREVELRLTGELNLVKWMLGALLALAITNFAKQFL